jgi:hypothetical protein
MNGNSALRECRRFKGRIFLPYSPATKDRCMSIGSEKPTQELPHQGHWTILLENECRESRGLFNTSSYLHAG